MLLNYDLLQSARQIADMHDAFWQLPWCWMGIAGQKQRKPGTMDRQSLRDWVHRYNEFGLKGLTDRPHSGRPASLTKCQQEEIEKWVEQGADLEQDGVVRFRCIDLRDRIAKRFGVSLHVRSVGKLLRKLKFRRLSVRSLHPKTDLAEQEAFKKIFRFFYGKSLLAMRLISR